MTFLPRPLSQCFMINAPWVFNALWYFIKGLLPARTVAKVDLMGSGFMAKIEEVNKNEFLNY